MKEMTDYEFEKKMKEAKEKFKDIVRGKPLTASPSLDPGDKLIFEYDDEHYEPKDRSNIISPGCRGIPKSGFPKPPTVDSARAAVEEMLDWAGAMSFMPEFDDLFDQIEKITRRKSKKCTKKI